MRGLALAGIAFAAFIASAFGAVENLTDGSFEDKVSAGGTWFVKFYAPWCGHCKRLAPTWENLSEDFADNEDVHIAHVDCTSQRDVCSKHGVRGYPTLQLFSGGDAATGKKYAGGRDQSSLKSFVQSHAK